MTTQRTMDEVLAYRAGYRHGQMHGEAAAAECERMVADGTILYGVSTVAERWTPGCTEAWCQGTVDGARQDAFRYLLSFMAC